MSVIGLEKLYTPMIVADQQGKRILANFPQPAYEWQNATLITSQVVEYKIFP